MAESDDGSFILIEATNDNNQPGQQQIQQHVVFATTTNLAASIDAWSEVSAPSIKSAHSSKSPKSQQVTSLNFLSKAIIQNSLTMIPGLTATTHGKHGHRKGTEEGYLIIPNHGDLDREASPFLSSESYTEHEDDADSKHAAADDGIHAAHVASVGSVGSRVPFSWAEIAKIQPQFQDDSATQHTKIQTRYRRTAALAASNVAPRNIALAPTETRLCEEVEEHMPAIPESDPFATKGDLGRRIRRAGKKGSRLKYPNGKKGAKNSNGKKKQQK
mmetsp:Transcript_58059/g.92224  ORF Transcript_58059/g.92224 Transcript_58059/m.92224 type:complete len:273 (+) Transcript_58059:163-981(+)